MFADTATIGSQEDTMGYAITESGSYRAVAKETILMLEETFHDDLPEWVSEKAASARVIIEQVVVEDAWRIAEVAFVTDQLLALEDGDTTALQITAIGRAHV